jgi:glucosyl-3-phosphoglycerate synthase
VTSDLKPVKPECRSWILAGEDFNRVSVIRAARQTSVSVVIRTLNDARTIGHVIESSYCYTDLVDELIVIDDHSIDATSAIAASHGAHVIALEEVRGRGNAMITGLREASRDLVVFLDGGTTNAVADAVPRLVQPLIEREDIQLVKAYYDGHFHDMTMGGGRLNELAARPILSLLFPGLSEIRQPVAGEFAARRGALSAIVLEPNDGFEIAMLVDIAERFGVSSLAQVDLGPCRRQIRPLEELRPIAIDILRVTLARYSPELMHRIQPR